MTSSSPNTLDTIKTAATWLADNWEEVRLLSQTAILRERYGLGFNDAVKAMAKAKRIRSAAQVAGGRT